MCKLLCQLLYEKTCCSGYASSRQIYIEGQVGPIVMQALGRYTEGQVGPLVIYWSDMFMELNPTFVTEFSLNWKFLPVWHRSIKLNLIYRKFPKYSDTQKICCNHSKIWTMWLFHRVTRRNGKQCSLMRTCTVHPGISVWKLRIITVGQQYN